MQIPSSENSQGPARVELSEGNMFAVVVVDEKSEALDSLTQKDLQNVLLEKGVNFGVDEDRLRRIIDEKQWGESIVVAEGIAPIAGENAILEFSFPTEKSFKPRHNEDGSVDYKEVGLVHSVEKDEVLLTITPPTPGTDGTNVLGEPLPAEAGQEEDISLGKGVYRDPENENVIKASEEGIIFYDSRRSFLEVQDVYMVNGSVDFATGNLHVKSSVLVRGDVRPGFLITTPYDVEINGVIEHATVECAGTLTVHSGITGNGSTTIKVGGEVHSHYIHNQRILCRGSVYITNELRNAHIFSNDEVVVAKSNGVIIGGYISAANRVNAAFIGSEEGIATEIVVGVDSRYQSALTKKTEEKEAAEKRLDEIREKASAIVNRSALGKDDPMFRRFGREWKELQNKVENLASELEQLERMVYGAKDPTISITQKIFPGTTLRIKQAILQFHQEVSHAIFKLENGEICKY